MPDLPNNEAGRPAAAGVGSRATLAGLVAGVVAVKLAILALVGPSVSQDTPFYIIYADAILDGSAFAPLAWTAASVSGLVFRTAGYPLVLAAAKFVAPNFWAPLAIIVQIALGIIVLILVFRVAARLVRSTGWALTAALVFACSRALLWDNSLMSDGVYADLFNIVILSLLGDLLGCWRLSASKLAGLGVLWGYSLWTRDNGLYFTFLPLLLLLAGSLRGGFDWRRLGRPIGFVVIVAAMVGGYSLLNLHRTGEAFFSLTGLQNYLRPLFDMRAYGYADPFTGDDLVSRTVRETMTANDYPAQMQFIAVLGERCHCTPTQLQSMAVAKFVAEATRHPVAYLRVIIRNFNYFDLASDLTDPINTFNDFVQEGTPIAARIIPGLSIRHLALVGNYSLGMIALMIAAGITKATSAVAFTVFIFGIPWLWLRRWRRGAMGAELWAAGFLWLTFVSVAGAFSLIHFEARHALPVFAAAQIDIVYMLVQIVGWRRGHGRLPQVKIEVKP